MPFEIVRNDITNMQVDAIVNSANPKPVVGYGVDFGIHQKAGPKLLQLRRLIGDIAVGDVAVTPAFELDARFVIHAVGPVWQGGKHNEEKLLRQCYDKALATAWKSQCESIAFPLLSAGNYGFPKDKVLQIAINAFSNFLMEHEMQIYLVVFNKDAFSLSEKLFHSVKCYIDENYVHEKLLDEYEVKSEAGLYEAMQRRRRPESPWEQVGVFTDVIDTPRVPPMQIRENCRGYDSNLKEMLKETDAGFSEWLLRLIDQTGKKDSEIYKKANIDRKLFSKIRKNPDYKPTKATALAFAIALELDLEATLDLIARAGYTLTRSSKFDIIVEYFILQKNYNIFELNSVLFEFDQPLIGG